MKIIKTILVLALVALIMIQFVHPDKNNGGYEGVSAFETETRVSTDVAVLLKENCYDCHSNQTHYPWYSNLAPFSYWQEDHVKDGKRHLNVSEWSQLSVKKKEHKFEEIGEMIENGEMPLKSYTWFHGDLSPEQRQLLIQWAGMSRLQYKNQMEVSAD